jgi:microfibrillar-associated protein 1
MSGALAARHTDKEGEKGRVEKTTVRRYWPGRAPAWVEQQQQLQPDAAAAAATAAAAARATDEAALSQQVQRTSIAAPVVLKRVADPRLARLAAAAHGSAHEREVARHEHRRVAGLGGARVR